MKILQVIRSTGFGGPEKHVLLLSATLKKRGHDIMVVAPENSWLSEQCQEQQLAFTPITMHGSYDVLSYEKLHRLIKRWKADIVHAHMVQASLYTGIAAKGTRAIPISTAHTTHDKMHMKRSQHIIAVSQAVLESLVQTHHPKSRLSQIYNGIPDVPAGDRTALRAELGISDKTFAVVCAAHFVFDKGQDILIRAVKLVSESVQLYLIGDTKTLFGIQAKNEADGHPRIHFLGYRDDVTRLLPAFDLYAAPSRHEGFSLSLVEAAAAGLPLLGCKTGWIPEIITNNEDGILVYPDNPNAMAEALQTLAYNSPLIVQMRQHARQRYEAHFTIERMVDQIEQVYKKMMDRDQK